MWLSELNILEKEYSKYLNQRMIRQKGLSKKIKKKSKK